LRRHLPPGAKAVYLSYLETIFAWAGSGRSDVNDPLEKLRTVLLENPQMKLLLLPDPWWLPAILAATLFIDAVLSIRPPKFIHDCLSGVGFPRDWWWVLIVIKVLAAVGLVVGLHTEGVGLAAVAGVVAYFLAASYAHIRARFVGTAFWVNCLGMLGFSGVTLLISYIGY
jgi:hypothetical protein